MFFFKVENRERVKIRYSLCSISICLFFQPSVTISDADCGSDVLRRSFRSITTAVFFTTTMKGPTFTYVCNPIAAVPIVAFKKRDVEDIEVAF